MWCFLGSHSFLRTWKKMSLYMRTKLTGLILEAAHAQLVLRCYCWMMMIMGINLPLLINGATWWPEITFCAHADLSQFSRSVVSNSLWPMNCSTPGLPVHHQLPEFTQTHAHWVGDAIQSSHPLSSPSPPAPNPSQHQGLFWWVNSSHEVAKVLEFQLQHQSFQWTPRTDLL